MGIPVRYNLGAKEAARSLSPPPEHLEASFRRLTRGLRPLGRYASVHGDRDSKSTFSRDSQRRFESIADGSHDPTGKTATTNANLMACLCQMGDVDTALKAATVMSALVLREAAATVLAQANQLPTMTFRLLEQTSRA